MDRMRKGDDPLPKEKVGARQPRPLLTCYTQRLCPWDIEDDEHPLPDEGVPYRTAQRARPVPGAEAAADVAIGDAFIVLAADGERTTRTVAEILADESSDMGSVVERSWVIRFDDGTVLYLENTWGPYEGGRAYPSMTAMAEDLWPERVAEPTLMLLFLRLGLLRLGSAQTSDTAVKRTLGDVAKLVALIRHLSDVDRSEEPIILNRLAWRGLLHLDLCEHTGNEAA